MVQIHCRPLLFLLFDMLRGLALQFVDKMHVFLKQLLLEEPLRFSLPIRVFLLLIPLLLQSCLTAHIEVLLERK